MSIISNISNKITRKKDISELKEAFDQKLQDISLYYENRLDDLYEAFDTATSNNNLTSQSAEELKFVSPSSREDLLAQCRYMYYRNPWARNIIDITTNFIAGSGFSYQAEDNNEKVQEFIDNFWNDPDNRLTLKLSEMVNRVLRDGEIFIRYFKHKNGKVILRFIDPDEIYSVNVDKNDRERVLFYRYYVTSHIDDENNTVDGIDKEIPAKDMQHIKINVDSDVKRGRSILEPALKPLKYYEDWLFGRVVINRMKSSIFLEEIIDRGSPSDVATLKNAQTQRENITSRTVYKLPRYGTKVIHGSNITYKWSDPNIKADDTKEDGRQIRLSIAAAVGIPEHIVTSDASNNNYSSILLSQVPYIRKIQAWQEMFGYSLKEMFQQVVCHGIDVGVIPRSSKESKLNEKSIKEIKRLEHVLSVLREQDGQTISETEEKIYKIKKNPDNYRDVPCSTKVGVKITWPPMISEQELPLTQAIIMQLENGLVSRASASTRLGYNYPKEKESMATEPKGSVDIGIDVNKNGNKAQKPILVDNE